MTKKPPKTISESDQKLWREVTKDVKILDPKLMDELNVIALIKPATKPAIKTPKAPIKIDITAIKPTLKSVGKPTPHAQHKSSFQTDKNTHKKLTKGKMVIDGTIDLHGLTLPRAHTAFLKFVTAHIKSHSRVLLVITGKGKGGEGIIKSSIKTWAHDLDIDHNILKITQAATEHGGTGAFYLLLRRKRV